MRILLPPSEAKTHGGRGRPLDARPPHPTLGSARAQAMHALAKLVAGRRDAAATALLLPPATVDDALAANAQVRSSATMTGLRRYSGVIYEGLAWEDLDGAAYGVAERSTLVFSGLFGVVRGNEGIPEYRVPATAVLPGLGVARTFWRPVLADVVPELLGRGLVIDLRSTDYLPMWRPPRGIADRVVTVRVLSPLPGGGRGVVSYPSKFAKGRLTAALARHVHAGHTVEGVDDIAAAWIAAGGPDAETDGSNHVVIHTA